MDRVEVAVVGAGSVGIAVAYYLVRDHGVRSLALIDARDPMSLTSAQSGENYRNWWPHPVMTAFTDHSITLMEALDEASGGRLRMTRGGYALATRREAPDDLIAELHRGYGDAPGRIRVRAAPGDYSPPRRTPWREAPAGVDVLLDRALIRRTFPTFAHDIAAVIHIRRAGSIDAQQMGQVMLEAIRGAGGRLLRGEVKSLSAGVPFELEIASGEGTQRLRADRIVNAAGPFVGDVAAMLGEALPVKCVYQQKIAFPDTVVRGASRLNPRLAAYIGRLPRGVRHYGGYYTMTDENWPLIGPMQAPGAFVAGALSGYGSMAACATGSICAAWVMGGRIPEYARSLSPERRSNAGLMAQLAALDKGTL